MPKTFCFFVAKIMDLWAAIYDLILKLLIPSLFAPNNQYRAISGAGVCRDQTFLWNIFSRYGASAHCPSDHLATVGSGRSVGFPWWVLRPWRGWRQGERICCWRYDIKSKASGHVELLELTGNNANQEKSKFADRLEFYFSTKVSTGSKHGHHKQCSLKVWVVLWQFLQGPHRPWRPHDVRGFDKLLTYLMSKPRFRDRLNFSL